MTASDLLEANRRRPFRPFRIEMTDGTAHEIRHPELLHVGMAVAMIVVPHPDNPHMMSRTEFIDIRHIVKVTVDLPLHAQG
ncbi:MAG: hypothetical protein K2W96_21365 [Gemmataceae bacterium]|nr:hypothetical protein [Gemmataceae bacterium]